MRVCSTHAHITCECAYVTRMRRMTFSNHEGDGTSLSESDISYRLCPSFSSPSVTDSSSPAHCEAPVAVRASTASIFRKKITKCLFTVSPGRPTRFPPQKAPWGRRQALGRAAIHHSELSASRPICEQAGRADGRLRVPG